MTYQRLAKERSCFEFCVGLSTQQVMVAAVGVPCGAQTAAHVALQTNQ